MTKHYRISYNSKARPDTIKVWRVQSADGERLARGVDINVPSYTETYWFGEEKQYCLACDGYGVWEDDWLEIRPE